MQNELEQIPGLRLKGLRKVFKNVVANDDVNLFVKRGTIHGIIGENGAGKSTAMKIKKIFLLMLFVVPALAFAGNIFGTITKNGKPFAKQPVEIKGLDGKLIKADSTDALGYFTMNIKQLGQLKLFAGGGGG